MADRKAFTLVVGVQFPVALFEDGVFAHSALRGKSQVRILLAPLTWGGSSVAERSHETTSEKLWPMNVLIRPPIPTGRGIGFKIRTSLGSNPRVGMMHTYGNTNTTYTAAAGTLTQFYQTERQYAHQKKLKFKECAGCQEEHIHDDDDYLCWSCRERPYKPVALNAGWSKRQDA